jgi:hypothetical protein
VRVRAALLGLAVLLTGCAGAPPPVDLTGSWPDRPGDYGDVTEAWTRRGGDRTLEAMVVEVSATLKSPAWRAAYVAHRARRERMSDAARAALAASEQAADQASYEVALFVATYDRRINDLHKGDRSVWRLVLVGDDGQEITPIEVIRDRRPRSEIVAYFPHLGDFDQPYLARFPRTAALLGPGARRLTLRMASAQGQVELSWQAR